MIEYIIQVVTLSFNVPEESIRIVITTKCADEAKRLKHVAKSKKDRHKQPELQTCK